MTQRLGRILCFPFFLLVGISFSYAQNCTVNADIDRNICQNENLQLQGGENGLVDVLAVWSQVVGPSVNIVDPNDLNSNVLGYVANETYTFRITATCQDGKTVYDEVDITVNSITQADAATNQEGCPGTLTLDANAPGTDESGEWSIPINDGGVSVTIISSPSSSVTLPATSTGVSTLRWTITHDINGCSSYDEVSITNFGGVSPVSAGNDQTLSQCYTATQSVNLSASFGGNNYGGQQGTWSMVSGPNYASIADIHDNTTTASGLIEGVYVFRWEVTGSCINGNDEVTITIPAPTQDVTSAAYFPNQTYCYYETDIVLEGSIPEFANEVGYWSQITSYPAIITNSSSATTSVSGLDGASYSTYRFRYVIENTVTGCTSGTDEVQIRFRDKPTIDASIAEPNLPCGTSTASIGVVCSSGSTSRYEIISGPYTTGEINAPSPTTNINFTQAGTFNIQFRSYIPGVGCTSDFDNLTITVSGSPQASNAGTDQVLGCNVVTTELEGNNPAIGSGFWTQVSGPPTVPAATIHDPTDAHSGISGLEVGKYTFRWVISAGNNCPTTQDDVDVIVSKTTASSAAGDAKSVCHSTSVILSGNKPKDNETGVWTVLPSAGISFADANNPSTAVTGMQANTAYTFTWTVENGCGPIADDVVITTTNVQGPSLACAGDDQCENSGTIEIGMDGNDPAIGTGLWTILSGPGSPNIISPTLFNTTIENLVDGDYTIQWSIDVPTCVATKDTLQVTIRNEVTNSLSGSDQSICGDEATMGANAVATGENGTWVQVSGNAGYTISNVNSPNAVFSNLSPGRYEFQWLIKKGICPSSSDNLVLTVSEAPDVSITRSDYAVCDGTTATLSANNPNAGSGVWALTGSATNNPTIASINSPTTTVTGLATGEYAFRWTITTGPDCSAEYDDLTIQVSAPAVAEPDRQLCNATETFLEGTEGTNGTWALVSGTPIPTISNTNVHTATVRNMGLDVTYTFRYTVPEIYGCASTDDDLTVSTSPYGTDPYAGPDQEICTSNGTSITMAANEPGVGDGSWNFVSGPSSPTIVSNSYNTPITDLDTEGVYIFEWNVDYGYCGDYKDVMRVNVYEPPTEADAGTDQTNACQLTAQLEGNLPDHGIGTWTLISAPTAYATSTVVIDNPNLPTSTISNISDLGTYSFRWTITNGPVCTASIDDVDITIMADPPDSPNAGADLDLCDVSSITMAGNDPAVGVGTWSQVSGPGGASIVSSTIHNTDINNIQAGTYEFKWEIVNGGCSLEDNMIVINSATPPIAEASGTNPDICQFDPPILVGNDTSPGTGEWSVVSGPTSPVITNPNNSTTNVTGTTTGTYTFRWRITNGSCAATNDEVDVTIVNMPATNLTINGNEVCDGFGGLITINNTENSITYEAFISGGSVGTVIGDGNNQNITVDAGDLSLNTNYVDIEASNSTGCTVNLDNQAIITVNTNPEQSNPVSDDEVCEGKNATVTIGSSVIGVNYEAFRSSISVGSGSGNGGNLDIVMLTNGSWITTSTITIVATSLVTSCVSNLTDQSTITVNVNPLTDRTVSGSTVCLGSNGIITISLSETGINYEAYIGAVAVGSALGNGGDLDISIMASELVPGNNTIDITATNAITSCSVDLSSQGTVIVVNSPLNEHTVSGNTVCGNSDGTITITASENGVNYEAFIGVTSVGTATGNGNDINLIVSNTDLAIGINNISVRATNAVTSCSVNMANQAVITVNENPDNSLNVSGDTVCNEIDGTLTIFSSENNIEYELFIDQASITTALGTGNDLEVVIPYGSYSVGNNIIDIKATNLTTSCSLDMENEAEVLVEQCEIVVYDGFSPNGDGINETFIIEGLINHPNHKVTIFNRWGNKVYEASPYLNDWDGTNMFGVTVGGNKLPVGTYFYIIDPGDGVKVIKGYIYLNR